MTGLTDRRTINRAPQPEAAPAPVREQRVPALMYHQVTTEPLLPRRLAVSPQAFAEQVGYLAGGGFTSLRAADLARLRQHGQPLPPRPVTLTFDDGFADVHDRALPLLASQGVTASLYVTTGWISGDGGPGRDSAARVTGLPGTGMLSWSQVRELAAAGIEIGAHTRTHPELDQLRVGALHRELADSKHELEDRLGIAVTGLSYPFGYLSPRVRAAARDAGYSYALAVGNRLITAADDTYALPRVTVGRSTGLPEFARVLRAERLPARYAGYRAMTTAWSVVRRARSAVNRSAQHRTDGG